MAHARNRRGRGIVLYDDDYEGLDYEKGFGGKETRNRLMNGYEKMNWMVNARTASCLCG